MFLREKSLLTIFFSLFKRLPIFFMIASPEAEKFISNVKLSLFELKISNILLKVNLLVVSIKSLSLYPSLIYGNQITSSTKIKLGICGEHGGDPISINFCSRVGLNYVSCSPYRVPVARLAAAQADLKKKKIN